MTVLWTSQAADHAVGGNSSRPWECKGISIDTRTLNKGDLFVALKGDAGDGHAFLAEAAAKGAAAAIVSESSAVLLPTLPVDDTLKTLELLGVAARTRCAAVRIAVTGSVGKTSTKEMLKRVLQTQAPTHGSVASYNNHWGVPLTLARMPQETQFGIFEVGMNHAGEIIPLSRMIQPHIAIITSIGEAHAGFFDSIDDIARAKAEIFEGMAQGGAALLNRDNPYFELLSQLAQEKGLNVFSFGHHEKATYRLLAFEKEGEGGHVIAEIGGTHIAYTVPVPGKHWITNSLAVLGAVHLAGADVRKAAQDLATIEAIAGRGQSHKGIFTIFDESYNANPVSMRAALEVLGQSQGTRKVAVLGHMVELGEISQQRHADLLEPLLENKIDLVYCCGPHMIYLFECLPKHMQGGYAPTSAELLPMVIAGVRPGDVISVKASLKTHIKLIVDALLELQNSGLKQSRGGM